MTQVEVQLIHDVQITPLSEGISDLRSLSPSASRPDKSGSRVNDGKGSNEMMLRTSTGPNGDSIMGG